MKTTILRLLLAIAVMAIPASLYPASAAEIGADKARAAAISILKGDPYGDTDEAVARNIESQDLATHELCSPESKNWVFRIAVPPSDGRPDGIKGYLVIDASSGEMICAGLPFLD